MLVMYTLRSSTNAELPTTSYIKFIDIWMLYGTLMPFLILLLIILIEHLPGPSKVRLPNVSKVEKIYHRTSRRLYP